MIGSLEAVWKVNVLDVFAHIAAIPRRFPAKDAAVHRNPVHLIPGVVVVYQYKSNSEQWFRWQGNAVLETQLLLQMSRHRRYKLSCAPPYSI